MSDRTLPAFLVVAFVATAFIAYGAHRHERRTHEAADERIIVDRSLKGDNLGSFGRELALNPGMFPDSACNPQFACPWAHDPDLQAGPKPGTGPGNKGRR